MKNPFKRKNKVKTYTEQELVSFGHYLLSKERTDLIKNHPSASLKAHTEDRLSRVSHADLLNWTSTKQL